MHSVSTECLSLSLSIQVAAACMRVNRKFANNKEKVLRIVELLGRVSNSPDGQLKVGPSNAAMITENCFDDEELAAKKVRRFGRTMDAGRAEKNPKFAKKFSAFRTSKCKQKLLKRLLSNEKLCESNEADIWRPISCKFCAQKGTFYSSIFWSA